MPIIRNPFKRYSAAVHASEPKPADLAPTEPLSVRDEKQPAISILGGHDDETNAYQLSVVNDSGVFLPPDPPEKKGFWKRSNSSQSLAHREYREALRAADNETGFGISRESFEGYRRSFDISARSPIIDPQRTSLDSRPSRTSLDALSRSPVTPTRQSFDSRLGSNSRLPSFAVEESDSEDAEFKDVDLNETAKQQQPKKKSFLARFGVDHSDVPDVNTRSRSSTVTWQNRHHEGSEELNDFRLSK